MESSRSSISLRMAAQNLYCQRQLTSDPVDEGKVHQKVFAEIESETIHITWMWRTRRSVEYDDVPTLLKKETMTLTQQYSMCTASGPSPRWQTRVLGDDADAAVAASAAIAARLCTHGGAIRMRARGCG